MSVQPAQTVARQLEASFRSAVALSPQLRIPVSQSVISLYVENEDLPAEPDQIKLPAVILSAKVKAWDLSLKMNGVFAQKCDLKAECRVAGNAEHSAAMIEQLAADTRAAIERATAFTGWLYLRLEGAGDARGWDRGARVIAVVYEVTALPAP